MDDATRQLRDLEPLRRAEFLAPNWKAPLLLETEIASIPDHATISGMFLMPMVAAAEEAGTPLPSARPRYTRFNFYPLREHVTLMFEAAARFFPHLSTREAMRKLGRGATPALLDSTLGRVVWASAVTPLSAIEALTKAYAINVKPGAGAVLEQGADYAIVELREVYYLLDSNHVGAFENALRPLKLRATVQVRVRGPGHAEFLVSWPGGDR